MSKLSDKKKLLKSGTIDDYVKEGAPSIEDALKHYDSHMDEDVQHHLFNNIFSPAQDAMYDAFKKTLDEEFEGDQDSIHGKDKQVKKAAVEGMKAFFGKASPDTLKTFNDHVESGHLGEDDIEAQYAFLSHFYDTIELKHQGAEDFKQGIASLHSLVEQATGDKKSTVGYLKRVLYQQKANHAGKMQANYTQTQSLHLVRQLKPGEFHDYIIKEAGKHDLKPKDIGKFYIGNDLRDLLTIRDNLKDSGGIAKPENFHLEYHKPKDKKDKK